MLTNQQFARYAVQISKRAASWAHDTMTMPSHRWEKPPINNSAERFCAEIEEILGWLKAEAEQH